MSEITEISRRAWNATKLEAQPEFDGLAREFVLQLESRAEWVMATGLASEGDEVLARFEQAVKRIDALPKPRSAVVAEVVAEPEQNTMAMAAPIPEDVKEELVEEKEAEPEPPKKKPRKVQKREPQVPRKPKIIKAAVTRGHATTTKKPALVAKKK